METFSFFNVQFNVPADNITATKSEALPENFFPNIWLTYFLANILVHLVEYESLTFPFFKY